MAPVTDQLSNPAFAAFIDATLKRELTAMLGEFNESMADQYLPQIRSALFIDLYKAGYGVVVWSDLEGPKAA